MWMSGKCILSSFVGKGKGNVSSETLEFLGVSFVVFLLTLWVTGVMKEGTVGTHLRHSISLWVSRKGQWAQWARCETVSHIRHLSGLEIFSKFFYGKLLALFICFLAQLPFGVKWEVRWPWCLVPWGAWPYRDRTDGTTNHT